jgi:hypothetical protein
VSEIKCCGAITTFSEDFEEMGDTIVFAFPETDEKFGSLTKQDMMAAQGYKDDAEALHDIARALLDANSQNLEGRMEREVFRLVALTQCTFATLVIGKKYWVMDVVEDGEMELITPASEEEFREFVATRGAPITWM